jgi:hypothetical protein
MANEELVAAVKNIIALAKAGKTDESYAGYAALFSSAAFGAYPVSEQRQALKFMVLAKGIPTFPSKAIADAHKKALTPLQALIKAHDDPADYELVGLCHVRAGDEASARVAFQKGLDLERARNPQSPLCGQLMKWVASV